MAEQIGALKFGVHIIVCTPGRMIDLLCANSGRVTNLRRVTYVCMDEADRMFDMGFEPQIMKILSNTRPDRQTVLFSATFPPSVEKLAKTVLSMPIEVTVGTRSTVNTDVKQLIEVRDPCNRQHFPAVQQALGRALGGRAQLMHGGPAMAGALRGDQDAPAAAAAGRLV